nr:ribosomal protein S8 [Stephanopyxis turris]
MKHNLWNMFANIKNGQKAKKSFIYHKKKKIAGNVLNILWEEGFILGYRISKKRSGMFEIFLKYKNGNPVIKQLQGVSKPSLRVYYSAKQFWKVNSNSGLFIVSTNKGLMTNEKCKQLNLGGEVFLTIN